MKTIAKRRRSWLAWVGALVAPLASAQPALPQGGDPRLPEALRASAPQASPRGAALEALVRKKLRANFDAADPSGAGRVTREQARMSTWPVLADHFDEIDAEGRGAVDFDDVMRFLRRRDAAR